MPRSVPRTQITLTLFSVSLTLPDEQAVPGYLSSRASPHPTSAERLSSDDGTNAAGLAAHSSVWIPADIAENMELAYTTVELVTLCTSNEVAAMARGLPKGKPKIPRKQNSWGRSIGRRRTGSICEWLSLEYTNISSITSLPANSKGTQ